MLLKRVERALETVESASLYTSGTCAGEQTSVTAVDIESREVGGGKGKTYAEVKAEITGAKMVRSRFAQVMLSKTQERMPSECRMEIMLNAKHQYTAR